MNSKNLVCVPYAFLIVPYIVYLWNNITMFRETHTVTGKLSFIIFTYAQSIIRIYKQKIVFASKKKKINCNPSQDYAVTAKIITAFKVESNISII